MTGRLLLSVDIVDVEMICLSGMLGGGCVIYVRRLKTTSSQLFKTSRDLYLCLSAVACRMLLVVPQATWVPYLKHSSWTRTSIVIHGMIPEGEEGGFDLSSE